MGYPVVHFEINGTDMQRLASFYQQLFGWNLNPMPEMNYTIVETGVEGGVAGGIGQADTPMVTFYVQAQDPQAALDRAVALGAKVIMPVTVIPGAVTMAQFADPEGNVLGIVGAEPPPAA